MSIAKDIGVVAAGGLAVVSGVLAYMFSKLQEQQRQLDYIEHVARQGGGGPGEVLSYPRSAYTVPLPLPLRDTKDNPDLSTDAMKRKMTLDEVNFNGKRVLIRVDYNCPIKNGRVVDDSRVSSTINTIKYVLAKKGVRCITLIAHMGRPGYNYKREDFTLKPVVEVLRKYLPGTKVVFLNDCVGDEVEHAINTAEPGTVFLCENLRFHIAETGSGVGEGKKKIKATPEEVTAFREGLSRLGDVFVFEGFGAAHRPHSSVVGVNVPQRVAGLLMQKEMNVYAKVLSDPQRPFLAILGGSKITDKIQVIDNLLEMVDEMIIAGGMAYTFKKILDGVEIGGSLFDKEGALIVGKIIKKAAERGVKLHLPVDHVIADNFSAEATVGVTDDQTGIPEGWMGLDVGPKSRAIFSGAIKRAKTVLWNGPLGVYEMGPFGTGTLSAMMHLVDATNAGTFTIIGGGDTGAASQKFYVGRSPVADQVSHVSTGGGSSLVLMEGKMLPGIQYLTDRNPSQEPAR